MYFLFLISLYSLYYILATQYFTIKKNLEKKCKKLGNFFEKFYVKNREKHYEKIEKNLQKIDNFFLKNICKNRIFFF